MRQLLIPLHIDRAGPALGGVVQTLSGRSMGTTWCVKLVAGARPAGLDWAAGIQAQLDAVVAQMSPWQGDSDLSRFNSAPAGSWHVLPAEFFFVLQTAWQVAEASAGAYDPTVGALVDAWGFGPGGRFDAPGFAGPTRQALDAAAACAGWRRLRLDAQRRSALQPGGLRLDLSAIAKGFAVDQVVSHLRARGVSDALVELGGELRGVGMRPDGQPWWVALEPPDPASAAGLRETLLALHGLSVATSGDYRRYFEIDGLRHAHTLDPRTGRPVTHRVASVSVVHPDCMLADAWSTALTVMAPDQALMAADAHGLAARILLRNGVHGGCTEHLSEPFRALLS